MKKQKLKIALEVLRSVLWASREQGKIEKLEQYCLKESISVEEVIYFSLESLEVKS